MAMELTTRVGEKLQKKENVKIISWCGDLRVVLRIHETAVILKT